MNTDYVFLQKNMKRSSHVKIKEYDPTMAYLNAINILF